MWKLQKKSGKKISACLPMHTFGFPVHLDELKVQVFIYILFRTNFSTLYTILYSYQDERRDIRSNIPLCLKEFPRAKPEGTPEGEGLYFTVHPEVSPNTDSISFLTIIMMIMILTVSVSFAPKNFFGLRVNLIMNTLSCLNTDILANDIMIICSVQKMYTNGTTSQGIGPNFTQK